MWNISSALSSGAIRTRARRYNNHVRKTISKLISVLCLFISARETREIWTGEEEFSCIVGEFKTDIQNCQTLNLSYSWPTGPYNNFAAVNHSATTPTVTLKIKQILNEFHNLFLHVTSIKLFDIRTSFSISKSLFLAFKATIYLRIFDLTLTLNILR